MKLLALSLAAALLATLACSPEYTYVPVTTSSAVVAGRPAADYRLAPTTAAPKAAGELRLATFGIVTVRQRAGADVSAIKVRMVVSNGGDAPWTLDTREQHVELAGASESLLPLVPLDGDVPDTIVQVEPGASHTVDLFFPLPPATPTASKLPAFDVVWSLQAGPRRVGHRTRFDRRAVEPQGEDGARWEQYAM